jgi:CheY-like chemotaxis protein
MENIPMASKKILIVDDEPGIVQTLGDRLIAAGYEIVSANDGTEALEKAENENPDLIIMDVLMSTMTGFEAMRQIRDNPKLRRIPALIISAKANLKVLFADIAGVEFIAKPYVTKDLIDRVSAMLKSFPRA